MGVFITLVYTYDDLEFTAHDSASINIACVRLKTFVVAQNLTSTGSRHGSDQKRVTNTMLGNLLSQSIPVPSIRGFDTPHIRLQDTLANWRAFISFIRTIDGSHFAGSFQSSVIYGLKDICVELLSLR